MVDTLYFPQKRNLNNGFPVLSLSAGCWRNSPAEKEVIAGWNLGGDHSVKGNEQFLGYARTILFDIKPYRLNAKV